MVKMLIKPQNNDIFMKIANVRGGGETWEKHRGGKIGKYLVAEITPVQI